MPHPALALPSQMPSRSTIWDRAFFLHPGISSPPLGKKSRWPISWLVPKPEMFETAMSFSPYRVPLVKTQRHVLAAKAPLGSPRNGIRGAASVWITSTKSASVGSSRTSSGVPWKLASTGSNPKRDDQCCRPIDRAVGTSRSTVYSCSGYALLNSRDAILWSHAVPWPCLVSIGTESFSVAPQKRAPVAWIEKGRWAKRFKFVWPRIFPLTLFSPIHLQIFLL